MNQYSDANRAYTESSVLTAPPERLTLDAAKDGTAGGPEQKPQAESRKSETGVQKTAPNVAPGDEVVRTQRSELRTS